MIIDLLFLSTHVFLLFIPILMFFANQYSVKIQSSLSADNDTDTNIHKYNSRFHILFRVITISLIIMAMLALITVFWFVNNLSMKNQIIFYDLRPLVFVSTQIVYVVSIWAFTLLILLYYRFNTDYRHVFVRRIFMVLTILVNAGSITGLILYFQFLENFSLPLLTTYTPSNIFEQTFEIQPIAYLILLLILSLFFWANRRFTKNRTSSTSKIYLIAYFITLIIIIILSLNFAIKYFEILTPSANKLMIFQLSGGLIGFFWLYLLILSLFCIFFSVFIYSKKNKFIGSQFSVNYTLKLAYINLYATLGLFLLSIIPSVLLEFYKYY